MAENNSMDNFDIQQENDFEKISAPGSASDQEGDGLQPADEPLDSKPKSQDGEVSTTTETNSGEDEQAEEDQFNIIAASEVEDSVSQVPLVSLDANSPSGQSADPISPQSESLGLDLVEGTVTGTAATDSPTSSPPDSPAEAEMVEPSSVMSSEEPKQDFEPVSATEPQPQLLDLISEAVDAVDPPVLDSVESEPDPVLDLVSETETESQPVLDEIVSETEAEPFVAIQHNSVEEPPLKQDDGPADEGICVENEFSETEVPNSSSGKFVEPIEPSAPEPEVEVEISDNERLVEFDSSPASGLPNIEIEPISANAESSVSPGVEPFESVSADVEPSISTNVEPNVSAPPPSIVNEIISPESGDQKVIESEKDDVVNEVPTISDQKVIESEKDNVVDEVPTISDEKVGLIESEKENVVNEVPTISEQKQSEVLAEEINEGCWLKGVDPRVIDLIYWRDVKKTGVVFGTMLTVLLCLAIFSLVSVLAYLSLALLTVSFSFVVYKKIMAAVQKSNDGHPFKCLLDMDISLKEDKLKPVIQALLNNVNATMSELRRLFFIEDIVDSIKFGLMLWVCTYLGCLLNGMTLIILALIMLFSLPKVYETYQVQIDNYIGLAKAQLNSVITTVQNKLPFLKKKEKAQ